MNLGKKLNEGMNKRTNEMNEKHTSERERMK